MLLLTRPTPLNPSRFSTNPPDLDFDTSATYQSFPNSPMAYWIKILASSTQSHLCMPLDVSLVEGFNIPISIEALQENYFIVPDYTPSLSQRRGPYGGQDPLLYEREGASSLVWNYAITARLCVVQAHVRLLSVMQT